MDKERLKSLVCEAIDRRAEEIRQFKLDIWAHPELGYKEHRTADQLTKALKNLGLSPQTGMALTGVRADLQGRSPGPKIGVFGELDAVIVWNHSQANKTTGAVHACGHDSQLASVYGAAIGLIDSGAMQHLAGSAAFIGFPAEEFVELGYRSSLRDQGKIEFFSGKQEMLRLGFLDDIDMGQMVHIDSNTPGRVVKLGSDTLGFVGKTVHYIGKEAHPGESPHLGANALNAAMLGLMGIHALRETFRDQDHIRVHPIITKGGDLVNIVPADVRIETYVRGSSIDTIMDANAKVNRALRAAAMTIGVDIEIAEIPGYLPLRPSVELSEVFKANSAALLGEEAVEVGDFTCGSTDIGDLSHIFPCIQPFIGGIEGLIHTPGFKVADLDMVTVVPSKILALNTVDLLWDKAQTAERVIDGFKPVFTKETYLSMWDSFRKGSMKV